MERTQTINVKEGPSPRVRGKHRLPARRLDQDRSIPACAGETDKPKPNGSPYRVHPRVCGGNEPGR